MLRKLFFILFFCVQTACVFAQANFQTRPTACTIPKKTFEFSVFSPTRYGVGEKTEVFSSLLIDWKLPNVGIKHLWFVKKAKKESGFFRSRDIYFGTVHNFDYPTMFFETVQDKKPKYISDTAKVRTVVTMRNELRATIMLKKRTSCDPANFLFTLRAGVKNSFGSKDYTMQPVDKAIWYRETVACLDTVVWFVGADLDLHFSDRLNILIDADFHSVDWNVKDWAGEHKVFFYGYCGRNRRIMLEGGLKVAYGTVFGNMKTIALPMIDVSYFFKPKKSREEGLFGSDLR